MKGKALIFSLALILELKNKEDTKIIKKIKRAKNKFPRSDLSSLSQRKI
jgi:hypothetical protein